jgi:hypothetical protein
MSGGEKIMWMEKNVHHIQKFLDENHRGEK